MNLTERKMVDILCDLKERHAVVGVKAEFEAEGTRMDEALRLKEVLMKADLGLTLKIGGCEALRDMYEARVIGVSRIVAPMIETPYALSKFLSAVNLAFPKDEREEVEFAVNIETATACRNFDEMLTMPEIGILGGIVIGRVDLSGSLGLSRNHINGEEVFGITKELAAKAKSRGLEVAIGGGVSADSLSFFRALPDGHLDRYETRKVIFSCPGALADDCEKGILKAVGFELLWLKNKRDYYRGVSIEDDLRIQMLEERYKNGIQNAGLSI